MIKDQWASYAKDLKSCIGWQTPKYSGKVYRGALHSPMEIFMMSFKHYFYIPSFTSTATSPEKMILTPFPKDPKPNTGYQNVIFEIDTTEFPNFSTIILPGQTDFDESESLLSCYNIFSWQGFRVNRWENPQANVVHYIPVISLNIEDYVFNHDLDKQCIIGPVVAVNEKWMGGKGETVMTRMMTSETLIQNVASLWDSYDRHFGSKSHVVDPYPLTWLNTSFTVSDTSAHQFGRKYTFTPVETLLVSKGTMLNGIEFEKLVREQDLVRASKQQQQQLQQQLQQQQQQLQQQLQLNQNVW